MSGCVLRARSNGFSPKEMLSSEAFAGAVVFDDGFNLTISESEVLREQIREAEAYLTNHAELCISLSKQLSPDAPVLDFGVWRKEAPTQSVVFPSSLVQQAGELGFELGVSIYEASDL